MVRDLFELRMRLVPYLYSAFFRYYLDGTPPFRALVLDYPAEPRVWGIDDAFLVGDSLLVAPRHRGQLRARGLSACKARGWTSGPEKSHPGGSKIRVKVPLDRIPVFVKGGTLLPLAQPTLHAGDAESRKLEIRVYGDGSSGCTLFEDDGNTLDYRKGSYNRLRLSWDMAGGKGSSVRPGQAGVPPYVIEKWVQVR